MRRLPDPYRAGATLAAASLLASSGCATTAASPAGSPSFASLARLYSYNRAVPLDPRVSAFRVESGVRIADISFRSPVRGRVSGYLVLPRSGAGSFPTVLWMPGLGAGRDTFLAEASDLAASGVAALLLDSVLVRPPFPQLFQYDPRERRTWIRNVVDLRRGLDFLATRPEVDMARLGYIGFSFGADTGTLLGAVDHRFETLVIASGGSTQLEMLAPGGFFYRAVSKRIRDRYIAAAITPFEPFRYAAHLAPASVLFQHGTHDPSFSRANQRRLDRAASAPKTALYHDAGHELDGRAVRDRKAWLLETLGAGSAR